MQIDMQTTYVQRNDLTQKNADRSADSVLDASSQGESLQRKADMANNATQRAEAPRPNNTGMPDNLKAGIESLSGFSMDDVRVHYNSSKPATVQALAYTQGTDIHVAPGQEKCLPHEAWHVAQQMAGRVSPTTNVNGMPVNDDAGLEHEADVMGEKAVQCKGNTDNSKVCNVTLCMKKTSFGRTDTQSGVCNDVGGKSAPVGVGWGWVIQSFDDKRDDPEKGLGYENIQNGMALQRDHVIPYSLIMNFLKKLKDTLPIKETTDLKLPWIKSALDCYSEKFKAQKIWRIANEYLDKPNKISFENYNAYVNSLPDGVLSLRSGGVSSLPPGEGGILNAEQQTAVKRAIAFVGTFNFSDGSFKPQEVDIKMATGWMPANVFLAPKPKADDPGDGFDTTFASAEDVREEDVRCYAQTYREMNAYIKNGDLSVWESLLLKLDQIAKRRKDFWGFKPSEWMYNPAFNKAYAKQVVNVEKNCSEQNKKIDLAESKVHVNTKMGQKINNAASFDDFIQYLKNKIGFDENSGYATEKKFKKCNFNDLMTVCNASNCVIKADNITAVNDSISAVIEKYNKMCKKLEEFKYVNKVKEDEKEFDLAKQNKKDWIYSNAKKKIKEIFKLTIQKAIEAEWCSCLYNPVNEECKNLKKNFQENREKIAKYSAWLTYFKTACGKDWRSPEKELTNIEEIYKDDKTEMAVFIKGLCNDVKKILNEKGITKIGVIG